MDTISGEQYRADVESPTLAPSRHLRVVVMGVSGCGKSTVGRELANRIGARFVEGDDLHSSESIAKMSRGLPLSDSDRQPWLAAVGRALTLCEEDTVVSCSALRVCYRDIIRDACPGVIFLYLHVARSTLEERLDTRVGHFMSRTLLDSQLRTLEPLEPHEKGITIRAQGLNSILDAATAQLNL